jgi:Uma2 family endonuclease
MDVATVRAPMSSAEFLAWDAGQTVRREFLRGVLRTREGASDAHVTVVINVCMALRQHLEGTACRTLACEMKLRVEAADAFFYPDVMVTCSAADAAQPMVKREPVLVVEVVSVTTAAYDRGDKFAAYRRLQSLREYVLIDPVSRRCDVYRLGADGLWVLHPVEPLGDLRLASVDLVVASGVLWAEVPVEQPEVKVE